MKSAVDVGDALPGGLTVVEVGTADPDHVGNCFDCETAFNNSSIVVRVVSDGTDVHVMHVHCIQIRRHHCVRHLSVSEHAESLSRLSDAVSALTELNHPGGEFEALIDDLSGSFSAYRQLIEG
ncbi:hypothetical protein [Lentzea sp. NPDC004782]|uniref:hypothetical protein n=1 Tax=Lentzea sp. NPDC004782 TaxID=3154458 RepID=UPI0033A4AB90